MGSRFCLRGMVALAAIVAAALPAFAEDPPAPTPAQERIAVQAWGAAHPECAEWTDLCTICARVPDGIACSTPGVACLPQPVLCRRAVAPPASPPEPAPIPAPEPVLPPEAKP